MIRRDYTFALLLCCSKANLQNPDFQRHLDWPKVKERAVVRFPTKKVLNVFGQSLICGCSHRRWGFSLWSLAESLDSKLSQKTMIPLIRKVLITTRCSKMGSAVLRDVRYSIKFSVCRTHKGLWVDTVRVFAHEAQEPLEITTKAFGFKKNRSAR